MKIAFSTGGDSPKALLDSRFGRAEKFIIYDSEKNSFEVIDNEINLNAVQGAGIQTAQTLVKHGVDNVVSGHCGPKAFRVLKESNVAVYRAKDTTVEQALKDFQEGKLTRADDADVEGHWQ